MATHSLDGFGDLDAPQIEKSFIAIMLNIAVFILYLIPQTLV